MDYTKGKWEVYESPFAPAVIIDNRKRNRPNRIIATCRLYQGSEGMSEAVANAHLIAIAPNMHSFLADLKRAIDEGQERIGGTRRMILESILAEAEGENDGN